MGVKFTEIDASLFLAVTRRRLQQLVLEGRIRQSADGTFSKEELERFIRREGVELIEYLSET